MAPAKRFYGWYVAGACSLIYGMAGVAHYASGIFFPFISRDTGWSEGQLGMLFSIYLWVYVCGNLIAGFLIDRIGGRRTFMLGALIGCTGLALFSTTQTLGQAMLFYSGITALGVSMQLVTPSQAVARKWFVKRAGMIAGIIAASFGVISALLFPTLTRLAGAYGWRPTLLGYAVCFESAVLLLALYVVRDTPEDMGLHPDGGTLPLSAERSPAAAAESHLTVSQALKTPQLWLTAVSIGFGTMVVVTFISHLQMWALRVGVEAAATGTFMPAWALPSIFARLVGGLLSDRFGKRPVLIGVYSLLVGVMLAGWLLVRTPGSLYAFSVAGGFLMIIPAVLGIPLIGDLFGRRYLGTLAGVLGIIGGLFAGLGPWLWGYVVESTGSYNPALLLMAAGYMVGIVCLAGIRPTRVELETTGQKTK